MFIGIVETGIFDYSRTFQASEFFELAPFSHAEGPPKNAKIQRPNLEIFPDLSIYLTLVGFLRQLLVLAAATQILVRNARRGAAAGTGAARVHDWSGR